MSTSSKLAPILALVTIRSIVTGYSDLKVSKANEESAYLSFEYGVREGEIEATPGELSLYVFCLDRSVPCVEEGFQDKLTVGTKSYNITNITPQEWYGACYEARVPGLNPFGNCLLFQASSPQKPVFRKVRAGRSVEWIVLDVEKDQNFPMNISAYILGNENVLSARLGRHATMQEFFFDVDPNRDKPTYDVCFDWMPDNQHPIAWSPDGNNLLKSTVCEKARFVIGRSTSQELTASSTALLVPVLLFSTTYN